MKAKELKHRYFRSSFRYIWSATFPRYLLQGVRQVNDDQCFAAYIPTNQYV